MTNNNASSPIEIMADHEQHEVEHAPHVDEENSTKLEEHTSQGEHMREDPPTTDSVDSSDHGMVSLFHHNGN